MKQGKFIFETVFTAVADYLQGVSRLSMLRVLYGKKKAPEAMAPEAVKMNKILFQNYAPVKKYF